MAISTAVTSPVVIASTISIATNNMISTTMTATRTSATFLVIYNGHSNYLPFTLLLTVTFACRY